MTRFDITVCCITYNHSRYIRECIKGFLNQKTNYKVEFIIHDDASTDNTQEVIQKLVGNDDRFKLIFRKKNIKSTGQAISPLLYKKARGKYIALCEGDDYWTDPLKLQKQVDFLEANEDYILSFSNAHVLSDSIKKKINTKFTQNQRIIFKDYLKNYSPTPTSTMVFKNLPFLKSNIFANIMRKYSKGDYILRMHLGFRGNFHFLNDFTAVYRKHNKGMTNQFDSVKSLLISKNINDDLNHISEFKYDWFFSSHDQLFYEKLLYASCREKVVTYIPRSLWLSMKNGERKFIGINKSLTIFKGAIKLLITKQSKLVKQ